MSKDLRRRRWGRWRGIPNATSESISSARLGILSTRLGAPEARKSGLSGGLGIMSISRFMFIWSFNNSVSVSTSSSMRGRGSSTTNSSIHNRLTYDDGLV